MPQPPGPGSILELPRPTFPHPPLPPSPPPPLLHPPPVPLTAPNIRGRRRRRPPIPTCGGGWEPGAPEEPGAERRWARGAADGGGLRGGMRGDTGSRCRSLLSLLLHLLPRPGLSIPRGREPRRRRRPPHSAACRAPPERRLRADPRWRRRRRERGRAAARRPPPAHSPPPAPHSPGGDGPPKLAGRLPHGAIVRAGGCEVTQRRPLPSRWHTQAPQLRAVLKCLPRSVSLELELPVLPR